MVSKSEVKDADYSDHPLRDTAFSAGRDEGSTIAAGTVGEVATVEVGEDSALAEYIGWLVGSESEDGVKTGAGRAFFNGYSTDADADGNPDKLPLDTEIRVVVRARKSRGGREMTPWIPLGELWDDSESGEYSLDPRLPVASHRRVVGIQMKNEGQDITYVHADSSFKIPGRAGE